LPISLFFLYASDVTETHSIRICLSCALFLFVLRSEIFRKTESNGLEFKYIFTDIDMF
jgi:hypothetical protein